MKGLATLLLLLAPQPPALWSDVWITVGTDSSGVVWFVRAGDMANKANYRPTVWILKNHRNDRSTLARMTRDLQIVDCAAKTTDVRATIGYSASGAMLWNVQSDKPNPQPVQPASMAAAVLKSVCPKA